MQRLVSTDGQITAFRAGEGRDLVILHSLLCDWTAFEHVLPRLAARHRVTLINLPGFHGSRPVQGSLDAYVAAIGGAFEDFGINAPAVLMGNGFGGTLALAFAHARPEMVSNLILVDAAASFPEAGKEAFRAMARTVAADGMGAIATVAAKRVYHDRYVADHPQVIAERRAVLLTIDPDAFRAACEVLVACDLVPALGALCMPALVVYGAEDQATPPALNRVVAAGLPGARVVEIPACGHCPPLERPADFLAAIGGILTLPDGT
jgi:3-oxoadipate enol-lactonase